MSVAGKFFGFVRVKGGEGADLVDLGKVVCGGVAADFSEVLGIKGEKEVG
jgi:hypothetical protein